MENKELLLSICIPTNGVVEWVVPVIESIYAQGVDNTLFEVVVTDNGGKPDLAEAVKKFDYDNFRYYQTTSQGFTNQIDAFEKCNGLFCKMLNHRSKMMPGSIETIINVVKMYKDKKPILYFAEGFAKGGEFIECANTDEFVRKLSHYVSWSAGTGAWKEDLKNIRSQSVDKMFPHILFLFNLREESRYVIWNKKYEIMASDEGKGGYDLFRAFSVNFLDILNEQRICGRISINTFSKVKRDLFYFLRGLYMNEVLLPTKHKFAFVNVPESMDVYYGRNYYLKLIITAKIRKPFALVKRMFLRKC